MIALLNPRLLIALVLVAALAFSHFMAYRKGQTNVRNEWQVAVAQANSEARRLELARQSRADEAASLAAKREAGIRADAVRASDAVRGLRDALDAAQRRGSDSQAAAIARAAALGELLAASAEAHRELAQRCDRHVSDLRMLLDAWPTDSPTTP